MGPVDSHLEMRKYTTHGVELTSSSVDAVGEAVQTDMQQVPDEHAFEKASGPLELNMFQATSGTLGEGAFGRVRRCRLVNSGKVFALKQMQKADIVSMGQVSVSFSSGED